MKLTENEETINKISNDKDKKREEESLRRLWRECFRDPLSYEDFYFTHVYRKNTVYTIKGKGMLHLNPYFCMVEGREITLHYIVGVATRESERRKGVMRKLLEQALTDLHGDREPFTYLMPADVRYYQPFDFVSISREQERVLPQNKAYDKSLSDAGEQRGSENKPIQFVKYTDLFSLFGPEERRKLFQWIERVLSERYHIFAKHDKGYFDLLCKEKQCQAGDVVFCFDGEIQMENMKGFFAYGTEGKKLFVEQELFKDEQTECGLFRYFQESDIIIRKFPYMVRIVHAKTVFTLFAESFYEFAKEKKRLLLTDPILEENNGIYAFSMKGNQISVKKQKVEKTEDKVKWDVKMTVGELADFIFFKQNEADVSVFFAEVI